LFLLQLTAISTKKILKTLKCLEDCTLLASSSPSIREKVTHYGQCACALFRTRIINIQAGLLALLIFANLPIPVTGQWHTSSKDVYSNAPESGLQRRDRSRFGSSPHGIPFYALRHLKLNFIKTHNLKLCQQGQQQQ